MTLGDDQVKSLESLGVSVLTHRPVYHPLYSVHNWHLGGFDTGIMPWGELISKYSDEGINYFNSLSCDYD